MISFACVTHDFARRTHRELEFPTQCGLELAPIVEMLGTWGQRWVRSKMNKNELDLELLMIEMQRSIVVDQLPRERLPFPQYRVSVTKHRGNGRDTVLALS